MSVVPGENDTTNVFTASTGRRKNLLLGLQKKEVQEIFKGMDKKLSKGSTMERRSPPPAASDEIAARPRQD
jgi:hypothetical protein